MPRRVASGVDTAGGLAWPLSKGRTVAGPRTALRAWTTQACGPGCGSWGRWAEVGRSRYRRKRPALWAVGPAADGQSVLRDYRSRGRFTRWSLRVLQAVGLDTCHIIPNRLALHKQVLQQPRRHPLECLARAGSLGSGGSPLSWKGARVPAVPAPLWHTLTCADFPELLAPSGGPGCRGTSRGV